MADTWEATSSSQVATPIEGKGFGIRAAAYLVDVSAIFTLNLIMSYVMSFVIGMVLFLLGILVAFDARMNLWLSLAIGVVNTLVYFGVFETLYGASPGKAVLRMRVVMEDGSPCTWQAALVRGAFRFWDGLLLGVPGMASMQAPLNQRSGDQYAHTLVLDASHASIQSQRDWIWFLAALALYLLWQAVVNVLSMVL
jgi:uncharacterized RDD family membrane protein YckC